MRQFHALEALGLSFCSGALYQDVAWRWRGSGAGYLLLVVSLGWLPSFIMAQREVSDAARTLRPSLEAGWPKLTLQDGKLAADPPEPLLLRDSAGRPFLLVDTTTPRDNLDGVEVDIAVTAGALLVREGAAVNATRWAGMPDTVLTAEDAAAAVDVASSWVVPLMFPPVAVAAWASRFLLALLVALLALPLGAPELDARARLRLTAVAMTPERIVSVVAERLEWDLPWWLLAATMAGYLLFAARAVRQPPAAAA